MLDNDKVTLAHINSDHEKPQQKLFNKRFWQTDYPLLCYPTSNDASLETDSLLLTHLADSTAPKKTYNIRGKFIGFIDNFQVQGDAKICFLEKLTAKSGDQIDSERVNYRLTSLFYKNPFEIKKFDDEKFWEDKESIEISCS